MTARKQWGIWSHRRGSIRQGGWIQSSIGYDRAKLKRICARMVPEKDYAFRVMEYRPEIKAYSVKVDYQTDAGNPGSIDIAVIARSEDSAVEIANKRACRLRPYIAKINGGTVEELKE